MNKKYLIIGLLLSLGGWMSYSIVRYATHESPPNVNLQGIDHEGTYKGVVPCSIKGSSGYKVAEVKIAIDGNVLDLKNVKKIGSKEFDRPFTIDTFSLAAGKHTLELEAIDASYHRNITKKQVDFYVDNIPVKASFLQSDYKVAQGHTLHIQIQANKKLAKAHIKLLSGVYECFPEAEHSNVYECFVPVGCEEKPTEYMFTAELEDVVQNRTTLTSKLAINSYPFKKARGFTVPGEKMENEKEISMSDKILEEALEKWAKESPRKKMWTGSFIAPIDIVRMPTPFGEIRTNPDRGLYYHAAVDIVSNVPKSVVWAPQDGKVIIKDRFLRSGNTIVIDHGLGVQTAYYHLDSFSDINVGDVVKKGNPLGRVGRTGFATGDHLHWEMRINNMQVNPLQWLEKTF